MIVCIPEIVQPQGENTMKRIIFTLCIFFALSTYGAAEDLYSCTGPDGNSVVTDTPQDGMKNCVVLKETPKAGNTTASATGAGDKVASFYNNCTQACNKSNKCESEMSAGDLKDCLQYCGSLQEMFKINTAIIDNPLFQNSLKGFECMANAGSCTAIKDCQKHFDDLTALKGTMSQSLKGIPGTNSEINIKEIQ
jgi:hypothetical protein